ncbi:MAG: hypothetical protein IJO79_07345 [Firmicutes bacterium]|nr:hypothetical protein [Clostridiales bacterium]MBQ9932154.1 hypothetical protein [Bacillota bacterium]
MPDLKDTEFVFEIQEHIGVLSRSPNGWNKELNIVSFNGRAGRYDIRDWSDGYAKMRKGVSLTKEEVSKLKSLLNDMKI